MWLQLLLVPLVLGNAQQTPSVADATSWLSQKLNAVPGSNNNNGSPVNLTPTSRPGKGSSSCTTTDGKDGKCVTPQFCKTPLQEENSATNFIYRALECNYLLQCCALDQLKTTPSKTNTLPPECGWSNPGGYSIRLLDDDPTGISDFGDFPWMVALLTKSYGREWSPEDYIGGGVLIHPSVVLTAAHKVRSKKANEIKCRAGEWDFKIEAEIFPHQDRNVRRIAIHNEFDFLHAYFDGALLFLEIPFKLTAVYHISTACLAQDMPAPGTLCYSMGWGSTFNNMNYTNLLKKVRLPVVDPDKCQSQLRKTKLGSKFTLHNTLFCAGGEAGRDSCIGDGGSPLVCPVPTGTDNKRYSVYGLVAYGVGCGLQDVPGVYTKVPTLLDWINRQMKGEQFDTTSYLSNDV